MSDILTTIIVPNYNGIERISGLLDAVLPHLTKWRELIIIDDGSTDSSPELIEDAIRNCARARLVRRVNGGRSVARNSGARLAEGSFLVFLDNDIIPAPGFLDRIENVHSKFQSAWITGSVIQDVVDNPSLDFLLFRRRLDYVPRNPIQGPNGLVISDSFSTQQLGVSRSAFMAIGGFDENLLDCEDFELSVRVVDSGQTIIHDLNNVVRHADYADLDAFINRQIEYNIGRKRLQKLFPELGRKFPGLFGVSIHPNLQKNLIRRLFVYNQLWKTVYQSGLLLMLPRRIRYYIYDLLISSTSLLFSVDDHS